MSRMTICASSALWIPTTRSRVDCGLGLTILSFVPTSRFSSVDFPTLGFPTTVTIPDLGTLEPTASEVKKKSPYQVVEASLRDAGNGLLSRALSDGVPSALQGLTAVFGMGTGVAPAL